MAAYKLTKAQITEELKRCGKDPVYFIKNYCRIQHPLKGLIPFHLYDFQEDLIREFNDYRFNIILKARQLGISTVTAGYIVWMMLFRREKNVLVVATKFKTAANLVKKVKKMFQHTPEWLKIAKIEINNQTDFTLSNGSQIKASTTSSDAGRSEALSLLVIDEAAFVDGLDEMWMAIGPTLATGGRCIALSTPNGVGNWFHRMYTEAIDMKNDFHPIQLMWDVHPERDQEWFEEQKRKYTSRELAQEFECFTGETKIISKDGFKKISDIVVGDEVLTHKGRFKKVIRKFEKEVSKDELVTLSLPMSRGQKINITKNHPILTAQAALKSNESIFQPLSRKEYRKNWKSISELQKEYEKYVSRVPRYSFALFPSMSEDVFNNSLKEIDISRFEYSTDITEESVRYFRQKGETKRFIKVDRDLGKIIGLYLSEGNKTENKVQFSFHSEEYELVDFIKKWTQSCGMNFNLQERGYSKCNVALVWDKFLSSIIDMFVDGNYCYNKSLKETVFKTNSEFARGIIEGIWLGDGFHFPKDKNVLSLANEKLIYQIKNLMSCFELYPRLSSKEMGSHRKQWYLELNGVDNKKINECIDTGISFKVGQRTRFVDGYWWGNPKIINFNSSQEKIPVFNIEVEEDNSYVAENLVVHNCNFNMSGDTVVDGKILERMKKITKEPEFRTGWDRNYWIWEGKQDGASYLISADVARGDGEDYSTFHVFKLETMEVVAEYQGKMKPELFGEFLASVGNEYGQAMIVPEYNTYGYSTCQKLEELGYPNLYHSTKASYEYISPNEAQFRNNVTPGFTTSHKSRPIIISKLEEFLRNGIVTIYSTRTVHELERFVWSDTGKPQALKGSNDDLIMALAIGCWIRDTAIQKSSRDVAYSKAMLNAVIMSNTKISTAIPGQVGYNKNLDFDKNHMKEVREEHKKWSWLYKG